MNVQIGQTLVTRYPAAGMVGVWAELDDVSAVIKVRLERAGGFADSAKRIFNLVHE